MKYNKKIHNQIYGYATKVLGLRTYRRGWLKGNCPSCGKADKFGMNLGLFRTNCFVCGYNPSPLKLVMEAEGLLNYYDTYKILGSYKDATYTEPVPKKILSVDIQLPDSYTNILFGDSIIAESARAYVKKRGFDINEVALKSWGYCTTGDYSGYLIIPFYMSGKLIYFNARKFMGMGSKYKNPDIEQSGMGKSMVMYNADALGIYHKIYLVEGVFNADTLGEEGVATGGKKIANYQISMVLKSPVSEVVIGLDNDAYDDAIRVGMKLVYYKKVKILRFEDDRDINDLGRDYVLNMEKTTPWLTYNNLLKRQKSEQRPKFTYY